MVSASDLFVMGGKGIPPTPKPKATTFSYFAPPTKPKRLRLAFSAFREELVFPLDSRRQPIGSSHCANLLFPLAVVVFFIVEAPPRLANFVARTGNEGMPKRLRACVRKIDTQPPHVQWVAEYARNSLNPT